MITIEDFLSQFVEGYLLNDLASMASINVKPPATSGNCGYPMVFAIISGCELLGGLLPENPYNHLDGDKYFEGYWNDYLGKIDTRYRLPNLATAVYNLVRHGVTHTFVAKQGIVVEKFRPQLHLVKTTTTLTIDATSLSMDFRSSYSQSVKPLLSTPLRNRMHQRLQTMLKRYIKQSDNYLSNIPAQHQSSILQAASTTASGSDFAPQKAAGTASYFNR